MKTITLLFIAFSIFSCSQNSPVEVQNESSKDNREIKNEISGVYALFENSSPSDGEWSGEQAYNSEIISKIEYEEVKENKAIFYCYDTQKLIKIEILGYINNAIVEYKHPTGEKIILLENENINGQFVVCPTPSNTHLNGGNIVVKSDGKILREIVINYEGCL